MDGPMLMRDPGPYVLPEDWRSDTRKIMELSRHIALARKGKSKKELELYTKSELDLTGEAAYKISRLSENRILSDPQYADKIPAQWAKLYELMYLPDDLLLKAINDGSIYALTKYQIWKLRGGKPPRFAKKEKVKNVSGRGVVLPQSISSLADLVKEGIKLEKEAGVTGNTRIIAAKLGIFVTTYQKLRKTFLLSERKDLLSADDYKLVMSAIQLMELTRLVSPHYKKIEHLVKMVWGKGRPHYRKLDEKEKERREKIIGKIAAIASACDRWHEVEIPYLSAKDRAESLSNINNAIASLSKLGQRINGEEDNE